MNTLAPEIVEAQQRAQKATGLDHLQVVTVELQRMLEEGILLDLDLSGFGMMQKTVSFSELGIGKDDGRRARFNPGTRFLLPKELVGKLRSLEVRYRSAFDKYGQRLSVFGSWGWFKLPDHSGEESAYEAFISRKAELDEELSGLISSIVRDYDVLVDENKTYFRHEVAEKAWTAFQSPYGGKAWVLIEMGEYSPDDKGRFCDDMVAHCISQMPTVEQIKSIRADYKPALLVTDSWTKERAASESAAKAQAEQAWSEARKADLENRQAQMQADERRAAIRQAELEHARQMVGEILSPFQEAFGNLRASIHESAQKVLANLGRDKVHGKTAEGLRNLIQYFQVMNLGDTELEAALKELGNHVRPNSKPSPDDVRKALEAVEKITRQSADDIAARSRVAGLVDTEALEF